MLVLSRLLSRPALRYCTQQRTTLHTIRMAATTGRPPDLCAHAVAELICKLFPFKEVEEYSVNQLESYDDRNFYFCGDLEREFQTLGNGIKSDSREFVFKLSNPLLASYEVTEGLNVIMQRLNQEGFNCPLPLKGRKGWEIENVSESQLIETQTNDSVCGNERIFCARVLTFIPGELMDRVNKRCLTPQLLYNIGNFVGRMDTALQDIHHPSVDARQFLEWDLTHFLSLRKYLPTIEDPKKREMAEKVFKGFEEQVQPKILSMRCGTIHGDLNGLNIILTPQNGKYRMYGIIDFGDCRNESYVFELAIMLAYGMVMKENPIQFVCPMLHGYLQAFPMSEEELDCLYYSTMARCCQSAIIGDYQFKKEPWNQYLLTTPTHMWKLIEVLLTTSKAEVDRIWQHYSK